MEMLRTGHLLTLIAAMTVVACDGGGKDTTDDTDDTTDTTCVSELKTDYIYPADGADDVFFRQNTVEVYFDQDETSTGSIEITDAAGASVAGDTTFSSNGETMTFTFDAALSPSTTYTATVAYSCDKSFSTTFTTTSTGAAVATDEFLGNVYDISLTSLGNARVTNPPGIGETLTGLLAQAGDIDILVSPSMLNGDGDIEMIGGLGTTDGGSLAQDMCTESIVFPEAASYDENPFFDISGNNVAISVQGISITIAELQISGAFSPGAASLEGVRVNAFVDTAALDLGDLGATLGDDLCATVELLAGVSCEDCGNGSMTCLRLTIENITADKTAIDGLTLVTADDVANNATCAQ